MIIKQMRKEKEKKKRKKKKKKMKKKKKEEEMTSSMRGEKFWGARGMGCSATWRLGRGLHRQHQQ
jgi:hypothetical protein